jgi:D-tyrosyl-tRNA(Tyr) deacylase
MRVVVQRVTQASVEVLEEGQERVSGAIQTGFLLLVGVRADDTEEDARYMAEKIANLRVFEDAEGKLNLSLLEVKGAALVVSNFTLYADCRKGRRPGFSDAAKGEQAESLYQKFGELLSAQGIPVQYGVFGAEMQIHLVNDGPITLLLDSRKAF